MLTAVSFKASHSLSCKEFIFSCLQSNTDHVITGNDADTTRAQHHSSLETGIFSGIQPFHRVLDGKRTTQQNLSEALTRPAGIFFFLIRPGSLLNPKDIRLFYR
jgi:hypothetical protein